jgi:hypothetical protein
VADVEAVGSREVGCRMDAQEPASECSAVRSVTKRAEPATRNVNQRLAWSDEADRTSLCGTARTCEWLYVLEVPRCGIPGGFGLVAICHSPAMACHWQALFSASATPATTP